MKGDTEARGNMRQITPSKKGKSARQYEGAGKGSFYFIWPKPEILSHPEGPKIKQSESSKTLPRLLFPHSLQNPPLQLWNEKNKHIIPKRTTQSGGFSMANILYGMQNRQGSLRTGRMEGGEESKNPPLSIFP